MSNKLKVIIIVVIAIILFNPLSLEILSNYVDNFNHSELSNNVYYVDNNVSNEDIYLQSNIDSFDNAYYPYYSLLNDKEKKIYEQIYDNCIDINDKFVPIIEINISEIKNAFEAFFNDHPEIFWINTNYTFRYNNEKIVKEVIISYNDTINDLDNNKKIFDKEVNKILEGAKGLKNDSAKEKYIYDYLVNNVKYDKKSSMNQSTFSAIVNKESICAGYSRAFQYLMNKLGIKTFYIVGYANTNHAWNIIYLNGNYYNVDLTWGTSDLTRYKYYNKSDKYLNKTHIRTGLSKLLPSCNK